MFIREVKEKLAQASPYSMDYELSQPDDSDIEDKAYVLPDGSVMEIDKHTRYLMGEILLRWELI